jgi:hypothetical protein
MIHNVTASGSQISRPVMKYFFSMRRRRGDRPRRGRRAGPAQRRASGDRSREVRRP